MHDSGCIPILTGMDGAEISRWQRDISLHLKQNYFEIFDLFQVLFKLLSGDRSVTNRLTTVHCTPAAQKRKIFIQNLLPGDKQIRMADLNLDPNYRLKLLSAWVKSV